MYEPLVLTTDRNDRTRKEGTIVSHYTDQAEGIDGVLHRVITLAKQQRFGTDYYAVYLTGVPGYGKPRLAGRVYKLGVGRWGVRSYQADSKPFEGSRLPYGYEHRGTLAAAVERVAFEFLNNVEYANRKAAQA